MMPPSKFFHLPFAFEDNKPCKNHVRLTISNHHIILNFLYDQVHILYSIHRLIMYTTFLQIITITNFEGEDRLRIKEMIIKTGAKYTSYMTQKNTIIICKRYLYFN